MHRCAQACFNFGKLSALHARTSLSSRKWIHRRASSTFAAHCAAWGCRWWRRLAARGRAIRSTCWLVSLAPQPMRIESQPPGPLRGGQWSLTDPRTSWPPSCRRAPPCSSGTTFSCWAIASSDEIFHFFDPLMQNFDAAQIRLLVVTDKEQCSGQKG